MTYFGQEATDWHREYIKERKSREPYYVYYLRIIGECGLNGKWGKKGIRNFLNIGAMKYLWNRDKAYLFKKASFERIDKKGDFKVENCRFVEQAEAIRRWMCNRPMSLETREKLRQINTKNFKCIVENCLNKHVAKGFCNKHYLQKFRYKKLLTPSQ